MNSIKKGWTRRKFIASATAAGTALIFNPFTSGAKYEIDPKVKTIVAKTTGIDIHNHMDIPFSSGEFQGQKIHLAAEIQSSGLTAICMTFCVDRPVRTKQGEAYERFMMSLDEMDEILKVDNLTRALNYSDMKKARKESKQVVIQSVEGGHFIEVN